MTKDTIAALPDPLGIVAGPLTEVLRAGTQRLIEQAIEVGLAARLVAHAGEPTEEGHFPLVRHSHRPECSVMMGTGPVPRVRWETADKIQFTPSMLPRYLCKARSIEELLPWLYLKGISSGDFQEALAALLGPNAAGLSSSTILRLTSLQ